jgi:hypothetical protein
MTLADEMARAVIEKLGYVVIPYHQDYCPAPGTITKEFGQLPLSQPFVITCETDREDYLNQKKIILMWRGDQRFPDGYLGPRNAELVKSVGRYFRATTD